MQIIVAFAGVHVLVSSIHLPKRGFLFFTIVLGAVSIFPIPGLIAALRQGRTVSALLSLLVLTVIVGTVMLLWRASRGNVEELTWLVKKVEQSRLPGTGSRPFVASLFSLPAA
jgi:hypothetical protein